MLRRGWQEMSEFWDGEFDYAWLAPQHGAGSTRFAGRHGPRVVNRWPGGCPMLSRKDSLAESLAAFYSQQGLDPWEFLPETFALPTGADMRSKAWQAFAEVHACEEAAHGEQLWLIKPCARSLGGGIGVDWSLAGLQQHWRNEHKYSDSKQRSQAWVAQKYVDKPLLWRGRKCDARLYVALESAPGTPLGFRAYAHSTEGGFLRTSARQFSTRHLGRDTHLTNLAVQKARKPQQRNSSPNSQL